MEAECANVEAMVAVLEQLPLPLRVKADVKMPVDGGDKGHMQAVHQVSTRAGEFLEIFVNLIVWLFFKGECDGLSDCRRNVFKHRNNVSNDKFIFSF